MSRRDRSPFTVAPGPLSVVAEMLNRMNGQTWRRVYGADHDDPDPGPRPGRDYRELVGGPLDGLLLDVTGWPGPRLADGAALATEIGSHGPGGHARYGPRVAGALLWDWQGDTP